MKNLTGYLVLFFLMSNLSAQSIQELKTIHKIVVSSGIYLEIEFSENPSLEIKSPDLDISCLINVVDHGVLTLRLNNSLKCKGEVNAFLCIPDLQEVEIMGKAEVAFRNTLKTDSFLVKQRSGGKLSADLDVINLDCSLSEGSHFRALGYAKNQTIKAGSKSSYSCFKLEGENIEVNATMGSIVRICATGYLEAQAKNGAYVSYKCQPVKTNFDTSGKGIIEKSTD